MNTARAHSERGGLRALIAAILAVLILSSSILAAAAPLHAAVHPDLDQSSHQCALTLFSQGHLEASDVPAVQVAIPLRTVLPARIPETLSWSHFDCPFLPGRGPPFLS